MILVFWPTQPRKPALITSYLSLLTYHSSLITYYLSLITHLFYGWIIILLRSGDAITASGFVDLRSSGKRCETIFSVSTRPVSIRRIALAIDIVVVPKLASCRPSRKCVSPPSSSNVSWVVMPKTFHRVPASPQIDHELHRVDRAGRLDDQIRPVGDDLVDAALCLFRRRIDGMRRAERRRILQRVVAGIDGDQPRRTGHSRPPSGRAARCCPRRSPPRHRRPASGCGRSRPSTRRPAAR